MTRTLKAIRIVVDNATTSAIKASHTAKTYGLGHKQANEAKRLAMIALKAAIIANIAQGGKV